MQTELIRQFYSKVGLIKSTLSKQIWLAKNKLTGQYCIAKVQTISHLTDQKKKNQTILHEGKYLQKMQGFSGFPTLYWAGKEENCGVGKSVMIVERLGLTLRQCLQTIKFQKCSQKTVCMIGIRLLKLIEAYHTKGYAHRNINLDSLQFGLGRSNGTIYFNDLIDSKSLNKTQSKPKPPININQFMSLRRLKGQQCNRAMDVQSIIYLLIYLLKGSLPWSYLFEKKDSKKQNSNWEQSQLNLQKIQKNSFNVNNELTKNETFKVNSLEGDQSEKLTQDFEKILCESSCQEICLGLDSQFLRILKKVRMEDIQEPCYFWCLHRLQHILKKNNQEDDGIFDWIINGQDNDSRFQCVKSDWLTKRNKFDFITLDRESEFLDKYYNKNAEYLELF